MVRLELGMYVLYDGAPMIVESIAEGRMIGLRDIREEPAGRCVACGRRKGTVDLLEHAPLLQDNLRPLPTFSV